MYLGLDFGTSSVKGVLIDAKQKIVATASAPLKVSRPQPGWSEQNPEDWWKACNTVVKTLGKLKPKAIAAVEGIGLSGQQHGATLLGKDGKALRPCILWNDARSFRECEDIEKAEPRARDISGNIPLAGFTAPKLLWVKKNEPKVFAQVAKVLLPKDYIRLRMTGEYASDMSDSSGTYWLDVAKRDWSDKLLAAGSMSIDQMPKLYEGTDATGRLTPARGQGLGHAEAARRGGRRRRQCRGGLRHRRGDGQFGASSPSAPRACSSCRTTSSGPMPAAPSMPSAMPCPAPGTRWASSSPPPRASNGWRRSSASPRRS